MHIDHLQGRHFFQHGPWRQSGGQRAQPVLERDLQAIGHEGDEDVRLDAGIGLVVNRTDRQVALDLLECLPDFGELDVSATAAPGRRLLSLRTFFDGLSGLFDQID